MCDEDDAHVGFLLQGLHKLQNLRLDGHVQGGGGLVGDEQLGLAGQGDGDHHPLAHTAGELVGILLQALVRLVDAHKLQKFPGPVVGLLFALVGVQQDDLADLIADGIDRVEARHGVLKDDGNLVAADLPHLPLGHFIDMVAVKPEIAADEPAGVGGKAHEAVSGDRFAGTAFAHDTEHLALADIERHVV
ncbi:hypothetical protein SDC9_63561 [bioreactor metagenome]|uniref:Uncharacterized protein n=1 Tax=bioreactor metagenome TaxID=1076179 RepID=A0A644XSD0_9ZZZZ